MDLSISIDRFRLVAILEGISYLLFGVTMPLKYFYNLPGPNYIVGMIHGILFIAYIAICLQSIYLYKWSFKTSFLLLLASLVPAGTFVAEHKILKPAREEIISS